MASNGLDDLTPFNIGKAGSSSSVEVHVSLMTRNYPREISLMIVSPIEWQDKKGNDLHEKYNQLIESLAGYRASSPSNVRPKQHKGVRVQVVWREKSGKILREREVISDNQHGRVRIGGGTAFSLDGMSLSPGEYLVTVIALDDDSRFDGEFKTGIYAGYIWK